MRKNVVVHLENKIHVNFSKENSFYHKMHKEYAGLIQIIKINNQDTLRLRILQT